MRTIQKKYARHRLSSFRMIYIWDSRPGAGSLTMFDLGWEIYFSVFFAPFIFLDSDMSGLVSWSLSAKSGPNLFVGTTEGRCEETNQPITFSSVGHWAVGILGINIIRRRAYTGKASDRIFSYRGSKTWLRAGSRG